MSLSKEVTEVDFEDKEKCAKVEAARVAHKHTKQEAIEEHNRAQMRFNISNSRDNDDAPFWVHVAKALRDLKLKEEVAR